MQKRPKNPDKPAPVAPIERQLACVGLIFPG
jgi:hypothetical protein